MAALCFLIFINDFPDTINESFSGIFADDTLIAKEIINMEDGDKLQNDLSRVQEWAELLGEEF